MPQALCVVYATLIFSTREAEIVLAFIGQLGCEALNLVLKRIIREERPRRLHGKGYGMPSSHAQFVLFWSLSLVLFMLVRHRPPVSRSVATRGARGRTVETNPWSRFEKMAICLAAVIVAAATAWSRVYLGYHTTRQVVAGSVAGAASATAWFVATEMIRRWGWLSWALESRIGRAFRARDLAIEEDICQAGWEKWEEKRSSRGERAEGSKRKAG